MMAEKDRGNFTERQESEPVTGVGVAAATGLSVIAMANSSGHS